MQTLDYLNFDYSDNEDQQGTWDAMAYVAGERIPALLREVGQLLQWACTLGTPCPLEEGGIWDVDLQAQNAQGDVLSLAVDYHRGVLELPEGLPDALQLTLTLTGSETFAQAFTEQFTWE